MAVFEGVKASLFSAEGGEVNNPSDYGHLTKFGISKRSYPDVNIDSLTFDDACVIYKRDYWVPCNLDKVAEQTIANQIFLLLINMDQHKAIGIIQKAIISLGLITLEVDGDMGVITMNDINMSNAESLSNAITVQAITFYLARTDADPSQTQFLRSWIRRSLLR